MGPQTRVTRHLAASACALGNTRGAVFLLSIYLVSLSLLLLSGIALQRTQTEMRASQVSRDVQQAFWLAEAALDQAAVRLKTQNIPDTTQPLTTSLNGATFTIQTVGAEIVPPAGGIGAPTTQRLTRQITATGTSVGRSTQVSATIREEKPLRGIWSNGSIAIWASASSTAQPSLIVQGDIRTTSGKLNAIQLNNNIKHEGRIQIGPATKISGWIRPMGTNPDTDGVLLGTGDEPGFSLPTVTEPVIATTKSIQAVSAPYPPEKCSNSLVVRSGTTKIIDDGNPLDLSGPGDGKIEMCLQSVGVYNPYGFSMTLPTDSDLIFRAPTTIYVTGANPYFFANNIAAIPPGYLVTPSAPQIPNGVKIIMTSSGRVAINSWRFNGSIFAPQSVVDVERFDTDFYLLPREDMLQYIVAKELIFPVITVRSGSARVTNFNANSDNSTPAPTTSLLSWTN